MQKITAAILIIGNEILSGSTQDINIRFIASKFPELGIYLAEARIIPDNKQRIIDTVLEMSKNYDYVFTTGGIGPTHDDITFESIAEAFSLPLEKNIEAYERIVNRYIAMNKPLPMALANEKMAMMPRGVALIDNDVTAAPGCIVNNVYIMAGIPAIMQSMFMNIVPTLKRSTPILSSQISVLIGESKIAFELTELQNKYPIIEIGSYPFVHEKGHATNIVLRGDDEEILNTAFLELKILVARYEVLA